MASKVYFSDFHCKAFRENIPGKLKKLVMAAGFDEIDMDGKFVAIKMHFGELGNMAFLRPNYARAIVDLVKEKGGRPFLTDCNTMYPGSRKNAIEHLYCAWENGFTPMTVGCPIIIGDGLKGTDDIEVPVVGGEYFETAKIGRAVMDADIIISLAHFKGHEEASFGGAIKNLGMGCGSRAGKTAQHTSGTPVISEKRCRGCRMCEKECANGGLVFNEETKKMTVDIDNCVGCGRCLGACNFSAINFEADAAVHDLNCRMVEYTKAVVYGRPNFNINIVQDVSPYCDCHGENDIPIIPDIGMFASFDPVAVDKACLDACKKEMPVPNSILAKNLAKAGFVDLGDPFKNTSTKTESDSLFAHAEKINLGSSEYEIINV
jgi:uncharacterized Fe-S center protein